VTVAYKTTKAMTAVNSLLTTYFTSYVANTNVFYNQPQLTGLSNSSFPRVGIKQTAETGEYSGAGSKSGFDNPIIQVDVWVTKDQTKTFGSGATLITYQGKDLCDYILQALEWTLKQNLFNVSNLDDYHKVGLKFADYDDEIGLYHGYLEAQFLVWDNEEV
jgi:hypothetical protein